jgi:subfamily B ATP-binding cassette protein MsbA
MFHKDWKFSLVALVLFPLCILPIVLVSKKVRKAGAQEEEEAGAINVIMQESFAGIRLVKSMSREGYEVDRFRASNKKMLNSMLRWRKALDSVSNLVEVVCSLGVTAALVYVWYKETVLKTGGGAADFITLNGALVMMYGPAKALSRIPIQVQKCLAATTKIFDTMENPPAVQDAPDAKELGKCLGSVTFENLSFGYEKDKAAAVKDLTLEIPAGKRYALVGPSGAGKSTLFSLLLRFYDPHAGRVLIDGQDLRGLTQQSLRHQIGVVNQDVFLFHDTILENIRYGRLNATDAEVEEAAKRAHAHNFILEQPNGYKTVIGDSGCKLSGGQKQRLAIARAFLRNAPILMLDEATSALDNESERLIQADLEALAEGRTVIAIAHRLSTIQKSDVIVVMQDGGIVAQGTHDELLEKCELYRQLSSQEGQQAA